MKDVLFAEEGTPGAAALYETGWTQPALFALETALYRLVRSWGVRPGVLLGHSIGGISAAHAAGVLSLDDACALVAARARLMQALPEGGAMWSLQASEEEVLPLLAGLEDRVSLAAVNGPSAVVVSGDEEPAGRIAAHFAERGRTTRRLRVSHAFHSPRTDAVLDAFREVAEGLSYHRPTVPVVCDLTGRPAEGDDLRTAAYWVRHARSTVRFADAVRAAHEAGAATFLEIGPGGSLCAAAQDTLDATTPTPTPSRCCAPAARRTSPPSPPSPACTCAASASTGPPSTGAPAPPPSNCPRTPSSTRRTGRTPPRPPPAAAPPEPPTRPTPHCGPPSSPATPPGWPGCSACVTRSTPPSTRCCRPCRPGGAPARSVSSWTPPATGSPGTPPPPGAHPSSTAPGSPSPPPPPAPTGTPLPAHPPTRPRRSSTPCAATEPSSDTSSWTRPTSTATASPRPCAPPSRPRPPTGGTGVSGVLSLLPLGDPAHPEDGLPTGFALGVVLAQALGDTGVTAPLWTVTRGAVTTGPGDPLTPPPGPPLGPGPGSRPGAARAVERPGRPAAGPRRPGRPAPGERPRHPRGRGPARRARRRHPRRRVVRHPGDDLPREDEFTASGTVLITGGTGGLGAETARWLAVPAPPT
ncbi:acyltransferase domain-containing protein [Streptomyces sp. SS52]|nr:acyltransferase domain-containing protein [Streptomyces sp. SS52]